MAIDGGGVPLSAMMMMMIMYAAVRESVAVAGPINHQALQCTCTYIYVYTYTYIHYIVSVLCRR